jgi:hypothetical protein
VVAKCPESGRVDDSWTIPGSARARLIAALGEAIRDGAAAGDLGLVRVASRVLGELVDSYGKQTR